jgi:hypothetical protein
MNWKQELDALIEITMALAKGVKNQPIAELPVNVRAAEQALAGTPKPANPPAVLRTDVLPLSERDEIRQKVSNFKSHQEKMARNREDYYLQVKARMMASVDQAARERKGSDQ